MKTRAALILTAAALAALTVSAGFARAAEERGFSVDILVDGLERPEYASRGAFYVEALRGRDYTLRVTNPLPYRVAVALSVDGLNTIDAKRTDVAKASKWVLGPYESVVIPGWQVDGGTARRFTFTTEKKSYGAWLGKTDNLGVIEAVFFRERVVEPPPVPYRQSYGERRDRDQNEKDASAAPRGADSRAAGEMQAEAAPPSAAKPESKRQEQALDMPKSKLSDEYAATGMGDRTGHAVESVAIDLLPQPVAQVRIRYEYRPELVRLGVLPKEMRPLDRREKATGFASYCPEPDRPMR